MIGEQLAHYRIEAKIGEGGMGEVYEATDSKLHRRVALKILPAAFVKDSERVARFSREAQVLASLNHPNIATLHGIEEKEGRLALVMELVEGPTLAERIKAGPLALNEALEIALQITLALEEAHESGIVHRDLKPANVKITPKGAVKVLDFGLAKAMEGDRSASGSAPLLTQSPTITQQMTEAGVLLGTGAYMSPEQARSEPADRRADIWAFGVVLMEMLTGKTVYSGKTLSDTLAGVLAREPGWGDLPADTPAVIRRLLERCLDKEPQTRLQAIGEARIAIQRYLADPEAEAVAAPVAAAEAPEPPWRRLLPWALAALLALGLGAALWLQAFGADEVRVIRATIPAPEGVNFHLNPLFPGPAALSPDGRRLAFSGRDADGVVKLYVRGLDDAQAHVLSGTEGAQYPFWSPNSRWIAFFTQTDNTLKKIEASGGPPVTLCEADDGKGGSWSPEGVIVFAPSSDTPLHRVPAVGGESIQITELDKERGDDSHRHPRFLPGGRHFLYLARVSGGTEANSIVVRSLEDGSEKVLLNSPALADYASGHLLFVRERTLMARPFDLDRLEFTGEAFPLAEGVLMHSGASIAVFSASTDGTLAFQTGEAESEITLGWLDREGNPAGILGDPAIYRTAAISPDGSHAAVTVRDASAGTYDLWVFELARNLRTRFTFDPGNEFFPVWSPDGRYLYYASDKEGPTDIYRKAISGTQLEEVVYASEAAILPNDISPDGEYLAFSQQGEETTWDYWILPLGGEREPRVFRQTQFMEGFGSFSPDGRWMLYWSRESGDNEIYVTSFPEPGRLWQISTGTGVYSFWRRDGGEIFYVDNQGKIMAVEVDPRGDSFQVGPAQELFEHTVPEVGGAHFAVLPDGSRFLTVSSNEQRASSHLNLVVNWTAELEDR